MCNNSYNFNEVPALAWYLEWEHVIKSLTRRFLNFVKFNFTKEILNVRSKRCRTNVIAKIPVISLKKLQQNFTERTQSPELSPVQILKQNAEKKNLQLNSLNQDIALLNFAHIALDLSI